MVMFYGLMIAQKKWFITTTEVRDTEERRKHKAPGETYRPDPGAVDHAGSFYLDVSDGF